MSNSATKTPADSRVETTHIVLPSDTNALGTAFGGMVMQWIDIAAAVAAYRHCGDIAVTASIDSVQFRHPIQLGDVVVIHTCVNKAWRTSMEVGVRVECEQRSHPNQRIAAVTAYLTFVAVDAQGKPKAVVPLTPQTEEDQRRFNAAESRRQQRLAQKT